MFRGYVYRTPLVKTASTPLRFADITLYTAEEFNELTDKQKARIVKIQAADKGVLETIFGKESCTT